jgi:SAM-dependent methyltransferase
MVNQTFKDDLSWEEKARRNPLFAVMSADVFQEKGPDPAAWDEHDLELFFAKGRQVYEIFLRPVLQRTPLPPGESFLVEFGCGMGRVLKAVAADGYEVAGIDISPTMLSHSRRLVPEVERLSGLDEAGRSDLSDACADFVYSYAVIQHIPTLSGVRRALSEMCRILKPGGTLKLQFRTLEAPFRAIRRTEGRRVRNFEHWSLVAKWVKLSRRGLLPDWVPALPVLVPMRHTNWIGVPLSHRRLESYLNAGGVRLLGIEEDVGHPTMAWAVGRKILPAP